MVAAYEVTGPLGRNMNPAVALSHALRDRGITIGADATAGRAAAGLTRLGSVASKPLRAILERKQNEEERK